MDDNNEDFYETGRITALKMLVLGLYKMGFANTPPDSIKGMIGTLEKTQGEVKSKFRIDLRNVEAPSDLDEMESASEAGQGFNEVFSELIDEMRGLLQGKESSTVEEPEQNT